MRIACALGGNDIGETLELYRLLSSLEYLASSPTLFNAGTTHEQLSSCFLLDSPTDSLESIYDKYADVAKLSKFAGGIGLAYSRVRSRGSLIKGTNGHSNGLVPWLKTLDASVAAVNQGGKRKGAACVYLESWHADIEEFLELRDNTGDEARRAHNLNIANWIPDEFMRRVEGDGDWSLFDPKVVPHFVDSWGESFEQRLPRSRGQRAGGEDGEGARALRTHDAHAGADRQRLDDLQGPLQRHQQPDGQTRERDPPVQPVHRDPRSHLGQRNGGVQPRLDQPGAACGRRRVRFRQARRHRAHRRAPARPGDRPQLLSDRHRAPWPTSQVAPGRARRDGPAGRVLQAAPAVRLDRGAGAVQPHRRGDLFPRAEPVERAGWNRGAAPGLRRKPRSQRRAAVRLLAQRHAARPRALGCPARHASGSTACATRC